MRVCRHVGSWLEPVQEPGKPRRTPAVIVRVAHLDDDECALALGVVLEEVLAWCLTTTIPARRRGNRRLREAAHTAPDRARSGRLFGFP